MPTEQTSVSVMNMTKLINSPYGQFITTLWRGSETREMIVDHVSMHYAEMDHCVRHGITLQIEKKPVHFNVLCFFIADLCFIKDVVGMTLITRPVGLVPPQKKLQKNSNGQKFSR